MIELLLLVFFVMLLLLVKTYFLGEADKITPDELEKKTLQENLFKLERKIDSLEDKVLELTKMNSNLSEKNETLEVSKKADKRTIDILKLRLKEFEPYASKDELEQAIADYEYAKDQYTKKWNELETISSSPDQSFSYIATILADYELVKYDIPIKYFLTKSHPAYKAAECVKELKKETRQYLIDKNTLKYQLSYIYSIFPELENFTESPVLDDIQDKEPSHSWIPDEKWVLLSDSQKNQIVLDNYIKSAKSKWQIGRDYELYVGFQYSKQGYHVDYYGSYNGLNDLGRDLIITKNGEIGIVQCKYWSSKKQIHEKHIAQLYGTVISYIIENQYLPELVHGIFVTNITLSKTAKRFAQYLGIKYKENYDIGEFPRIKCNIGKDENGLPVKIYHLPTDQQYDSVKICNKGEFFAYTVQEAESKGFRRAYRWHS